MALKLKTKPCDSCAGSGKVPGDGTGAQLRKERERLGITAAAVLRHMGISDTYIGDLEKDRRPWTGDLVGKYQAALAALNGGEA